MMHSFIYNGPDQFVRKIYGGKLSIIFKEQMNRKVFRDLLNPKVCIETDKNYHEEPVFTHSASILLPNYQQEKIKTVKDTCSSKTGKECIDHVIQRFSLQQKEFAYQLILNELISNMEQRNYLNAMNTRHLFHCKYDYIIIIEVVPQQRDEWNVTVTDRDKTATTFKSRNTNDMLNTGIEALCSLAFYLSSCLSSSNKDHVSLMINLKLYQLSLNETDEILLKVNRNDRECLNVQVYNNILHYRSRLTKLIHCCDYVGLLMVIVQQVQELRSLISLLVKLCDGLVLQTESDWWRFKPVANRDFDLWELLFAVCHPKQRIVCADGSMAIILKDSLINLTEKSNSFNKVVVNDINLSHLLFQILHLESFLKKSNLILKSGGTDIPFIINRYEKDN